MAYLEAWDATGDRFYLDAARETAIALVRGQLCSGGWDYIIEWNPDLRKKYAYRVDKNCGPGAPRTVTVLDDNVTQACLRFLMRVDRELGFKEAAIHEAAEFALESLMRAQYPNGAWPQRYIAPPDPEKFPVKKASYPASWPRKWPNLDYRDYYTFNDNTIADCIDTMLEAAKIYKSDGYMTSAKKGGDFILLAQMPDPQPGWAQQYNLDMHPAWARQFEPPSVSGGETQGILRMLMVLYRDTGDRRYLEPIPRALAWLKSSILPRPANPSEAWRRQRSGEPVVARFYELQTNKPLFITKGTMVSAKGLGSARIDGYELSYSDESVITHYGVLTSGADIDPIERDYRAIEAKHEPRPDRLHGLSPWAERSARRRAPNAARLGEIITTLDTRGAWTEEGTIGKADRVASVFAARDMVVTIGNRSFPLKESETLQVFQGEQPPKVRIIRSSTFAERLEALAAAVAASR
jgi:PelA/Pel-15E family pectate lyase